MVDEFVFPSPKDKVKFLNADISIFPRLTETIKDAKKLLLPGEVYTIKSIVIHDWWTEVWLEEVKENVSFHLNFFQMI